MNTIPVPIFQDTTKKISWEKIYEREYGVQYSEVAVSLLANASYHFPKTSIVHVVIPSSGGTAFYIDAQSWVMLVEGLNKKYTAHVKNLEKYEKQFVSDGEAYLKIAKEISATDLKSLSDTELLSLFTIHQDKRYRYSAFAWSAFILNNYVADRATKIIDSYLKKVRKEDKKQEVLDSLFSPHKRAAILQLQYEVQKQKGKLTSQKLTDLWNRFKWLSCLDIHNKSWTRKEFEKHIEPFYSSSSKKIISFEKFVKELEFEDKDLEYLMMAKRFVYIKDARDDYRRESVLYTNGLFEEIAKRMKLAPSDPSYLQEQEIIDFLSRKKLVDQKEISERKKGFVIYLDTKGKLVCLHGKDVSSALEIFQLFQKFEKPIEIIGRVACQGTARGKVVIVNGVKDVSKVQIGDVLVAVTTHPDFVSAMRKAVAIVTDEGGITSHAAIISREFGIPCIVGCKNATKLLKNGDLVDIDAINGKVVRLRYEKNSRYAVYSSSKSP